MNSMAIFLDVDGILTSLRTHRAYGEKGTADFFDPVAIAFLIKKLNKHQELKIVLSTSWRRIYNPDNDETITTDFARNFVSRQQRPVDQLVARFELEGILPRHFHNDYHTKLERTGFRNDAHCDKRDEEIAEWLSRHPEVKNFIILDDDYIVREELRPFWIETTWEDGMQYHHYKKFEKLLEQFGLEV